MTRYLLDTNHISPLVTISHPLRDRIFEAGGEGNQFYIPVLALSELMYGFLSIPRAEQNRAEWARIESLFTFIDVVKEDVEQAAQLRIELRKQGWQLKLVDAVIAITALSNDLILLTTDRDFARVPLLRTENWRTG